ncbi:hypothetical protein D3C71_2021460 [compost metagenome]
MLLFQLAQKASDLTEQSEKQGVKLLITVGAPTVGLNSSPLVLGQAERSIIGAVKFGSQIVECPHEYVRILFCQSERAT